MPQFDISTYYSQIFWLTAGFGLLYLIIANFIAPKAEQILQTRKDNLEDNINNANILSTRAQILKEKYEIELKEIFAASANITQVAVRGIETLFAKKLSELNSELDHLHKSTLQEIEHVKNGFSLEKQQTITNVADFIIESILNKKADQKLLKECYEKVK